MRIISPLKNLIFLAITIGFTLLLLKRLLGPYAIVVPVLYIFFDVNAGIRVVLLFVKRKWIPIFWRRGDNDFLETSKIKFFVLPSDMDINLHMNNGRYLRECEFGRIDFWISNGMFEVMDKNNTAVTVTATCARYRRSLHLYQKIVLQTRVLAWDEDAFYLEQRFVGKDGFVHALVLSKNKTVSRDNSGRLFMPEELVSLLYGECKESPRKSEDLELWIKYNSVSCERLRTISLPTDATN